MRIFSFKESINFIDRYDVFLGYSLHRESSEITGFNVSRDEAITENLTNNIDDLNEILKGYYFDVNFFKTYIENDEDDPIKCIAMFKLKKKDSEDLYLSVHNAHNGYYFHGFELNKVKIDRNKKIEFLEKNIKRPTCLSQ